MSKPWKTLIIDDEELARLRLRRLLSAYHDLIEIVGEAVNGQDGLEKIEQLKPDLIFLDIEMPVYNGFEMLAKLNNPPQVIFTTAYDHYAIKAFEEDSVDYLLKPVEPERLEITIRRLEKNNRPGVPDLPLDSLIRQLTVKSERKTLTVKIGDRILLVKTDDIAYIQAEDKYVFLCCLDGKRHLTEFTVSSLEEKLPGSFLRINRGTIINTDHIAEIRKGFNGALTFILKDKENTRISSSRRYGEMLREHFDI
ncbi:LytR/AlgR family response regulator transcription factor [Arcticibacter sp. MXS-1]|uniref:LytR/AlgR family response regulator transcription factor n=1 Tax=Arcticibacter sp. MXS-1 TaxID=3341726 RepID=UPI0035A8BF18